MQIQLPRRTSPWRRRFHAGAVAAAAAWLVVASSARALTLGTPTAALGGTNSVNELVDTNSPPVTRIRTSSVSTLSSDATSFQTRYAMTVGTDIGNTGSITESHTASYSISFTVNHTAGATWWLFVDTSRVGALTLVNDGNGNASATLGAVSGAGGGAGSLTSGSLGVAAVPTLSSAAGGNTAFNQTSSAVLTGTGTGADQLVTLGFTWTASATSTRGGNAGDEAAIRMGIAGIATSYSAGNYPGVGARTLANDGHFVRATLVPEPGTAALALTGLAGLVIASRRRAQRVASGASRSSTSIS